MPIAKFQLPDGRVARFDVPDGTTPEQAQSMAESQLQSMSAPEAPEPEAPEPDVTATGAAEPTPTWGPTDAAINGLTFGTLPNIKAAGAAAGDALADALGVGDNKSLSDYYDAALEGQQAARRGYASDNPVVDIIANLVGGAATGGGLAKGGLSLAARAADKGRGLLGTTLGAIGDGTILGALSGAGNAEGGAENRLAGAGEGALAGATAGAILPTAGRAVKAAAGNVGSAIKGYRNPEGAAKDQLMAAMLRDDITPSEIANKVAEATGRGSAGYTLADAAGKNVRRAAAAAVKTPSSFREQASDFMQTRQGGQYDRLNAAKNAALGVGDDATSEAARLEAALKEKAGPLYEAAYSQPAPQGQFYDDLLQKKSVQDAIGAARRVAAEQDTPLSSLFTEVPESATRINRAGLPVVERSTRTAPTTRGWDYVRRELGDSVGKLFSNSDSADKSLGSAVLKTKNALQNQLAADNPDYARAVATYADAKAAQDAIQAGRGMAAATRPGETRAAFAALPEGQQDLARLGASERLKEVMGKAPYGTDKTRVFTRPNMQQNMETLARGPDELAAFNARLQDEGDMASTMRQLLGGSSTAENLADLAGLDNGTVLAALSSGNTRAAAGRVIASLLQRGRGMTEAKADALGKMLLEQDPQKIAALQKAFEDAIPVNNPSDPTALIAAILQGRQTMERQ